MVPILGRREELRLRVEKRLASFIHSVNIERWPRAAGDGTMIKIGKALPSSSFHSSEGNGR